MMTMWLFWSLAAWTSPTAGIHVRDYLLHRNDPPAIQAALPPGQRPRPRQPVPYKLSRTVYGFYPYWVSCWQTLRWNLLTHIAVFGVEISGTGQVVNAHGWPGSWAALVDSAHAHGVQVHLTILLFNGADIHSVLTDPTARATAIQTIRTQALAGGADGVNLDFEVPYASDSAAFASFVNELADSLAVDSLRLVVDVTAVNWNNRYSVPALTQNADLFIMGYDYHWSGSSVAGPVAPLQGETYNVTATVSYYVQNATAPDRLILGVPYYGYNWPTVNGNRGSSTRGSGSAVLYTQTSADTAVYGYIWDATTSTPWYRYTVTNDGWYQTWFDDSVSLGLKYDLVNAQNLQGTGMWALCYDAGRDELWNTLAAHFGGPLPPARIPTWGIWQTPAGSIRVWLPLLSNTDSITVERSSNGAVYTSLVTLPYDTLLDLTGLLPLYTLSYVRVRARNPQGSSQPSEVLAIVPSDTGIPVLLVHGVDREAGTVNTHDFVRQHAAAIWAHHHPLTSVANELVESGRISLQNYTMVDWILGEEGTATHSFSPAEQAAVQAFLESGGKLFVSGSEIGYDLVQQGSAQDQTFYTNYLKATYLGDDAATHTAAGVSGTLFHGLTVAFDDGTHGGYDVDYPDGVGPAGGSVSVMTYTGGTGWSAGVAYTGTFGSSGTPGQLVYLGFPFEMVYDYTLRNQMMGRILAYFGFPVAVEESPTPRAPLRPHIRWSGHRLHLQLPSPGPADLFIVDAAGRTVFHRTGTFGSRMNWPLRLPAGIYTVRLHWKGTWTRTRLVIPAR